MSGQPSRRNFHDELDQLRLQVELMGVRVLDNLDRMCAFVTDCDLAAAEASISADDEIDAMNVSLTERCHDLLARENPVASDLRLIVSVLRILGEFERVGDLALRVTTMRTDHDLLAAVPSTFAAIRAMASGARDSFSAALTAWSAQDLQAVDAIAAQAARMDEYHEQLSEHIVSISGDDAVRIATTVLLAGRSLERISDHSMIVGARLRYLITADPRHLASEIR